MREVSIVIGARFNEDINAVTRHASTHARTRVGARTDADQDTDEPHTPTDTLDRIC